jgi:putative ABC transport system permease protein
MLTLTIALRNIYRNTRRSLTTLATIALGAAAVSLFGAFITYIEYGVQTGAIQQTGHLQVFRTGYFDFGAASPAAWGMENYQAVLRLIKEDPEMKSLSTVVTPIQSLVGIVGSSENNTSKTFFGTGFVPSERDRMKQWNEYGTGSQGLKQSGLRDGDLLGGISGVGLVRILGLCRQLNLDECPTAPTVSGVGDAPARPPSVDLGELTKRDRPVGNAAQRDSEPTVDLLAATAGGAPNVVGLQITGVELQSAKELDDNYIGMNIGLAQNLVYGRGDHKATGIIVQLKRTEDMPRARARLSNLFKEHGLDLEVRDFTQLNPQYTQIIGLFGSIFSFISVIIGIVVVFTVSNAMSMSVVERTGEIGTMRAMGVRRKGIRHQFLVEGSLLGLIGATCGVVIAYIAAFGVNHSLLTWTPPGRVAPVPLILYMTGAYTLIALTWFGLAVISSLASMIPANRAGRMTVVDALRHV